MFEKVNPSHPDKVADRIAGALVDLAYKVVDNPKIAVEVLIGHGTCNIIVESSVGIAVWEVQAVVERIAGPNLKLNYLINPQDPILASNQDKEIRCGDNGIFKGCPITHEQQHLANIAREIYAKYPTDGKYIYEEGFDAFAKDKLIICQSVAKTSELEWAYPGAIVNPLGYWTGGLDVDSGATNRKLGSDMGDAVTGGGLHGKDLSKADVSVNIWCHLQAQKVGRPVTACCAIGDDEVDGVPYPIIVDAARAYVNKLGGFEKLAEWGLI